MWWVALPAVGAAVLSAYNLWTAFQNLKRCRRIEKEIEATRRRISELGQ